MRHPKQVRQIDRTGCGIACVASVSALSYKETMQEAGKIFGWDEAKPRSFYTKSGQLVDLLTHLKINAGRNRTVRKWESLPSLAIVAINKNERGNWHWVVFSRKGEDCVVIDPRSKSAERRDFTRMRLLSFIPVESPIFLK